MSKYHPYAWSSSGRTLSLDGSESETDAEGDWNDAQTPRAGAALGGERLAKLSVLGRVSSHSCDFDLDLDLSLERCAQTPDLESAEEGEEDDEDIAEESGAEIVESSEDIFLGVQYHNLGLEESSPKARSQSQTRVSAPPAPSHGPSFGIETIPSSSAPAALDGYNQGEESLSDDELMSGDPSAAYTAFRERLALGKKRGRKSLSDVKAKTRASSAHETDHKNKDNGAKQGTRRHLTRGSTECAFQPTATAVKRKRADSDDDWTSTEESESEDRFGDEDEEHPDDNLPAYLTKRRNALREAQSRNGRLSSFKSLEASGYLFPPCFDGIHFFDDESAQELPTRPNLGSLKPVREHKSIVLDHGTPLSGPAAPPGSVPPSIAQRLRDYQVQGAQFLYSAFVNQRGCILGDDMGLGKTIQVISFLAAAFGKFGDIRDSKAMRKVRRVPDGRFYPRVLIVCPGSLMDNWAAELRTWGWWEVYKYHGSTAHKDEAIKAARGGMTEIVITTYTTFTKHADELNSVEWSAVIADECHVIKSRTSLTTRAMNGVNALCRIGLTGTAIQNDYAELWTLLNWTNPGTFGDIRTWEKFVSRPLRLGQAHGASVRQLAKARRTAEMVSKNLLPRVFLRRVKGLIRDQLPKKRDRVVFCPMGVEQTRAYKGLASGRIVKHLRTAGTECACGSGKKFGWCCGAEVDLFSEDEDGPALKQDDTKFGVVSRAGEDEEVEEVEEGAKNSRKWQTLLFPAIQTLQKAANHSCLLLPHSVDSPDRHRTELAWLKQAFRSEWKAMFAQRDNVLFPASEEFCGKWTILKQLLRLWDGQGDKVLVFSHSVRLLRMLKMLFTAGTAYNVLHLDGSMSYGDRTEAVAKFNSSPHPDAFIFLISSRAGGVGLNIPTANKVVIMDPNWNPAHDLQTQDRAYRIGQTRDVDVFRLVSVGTIEEVVYARQVYKQQMAQVGYEASAERRYFDGVQNEGGRKGEIFGLANLLAEPDDGGGQDGGGQERDGTGSSAGPRGMLRQIVNKTNVAESRAGVMIAEFGAEGDAGADEDEYMAIMDCLDGQRDGFDAGDGGGERSAGGAPSSDTGPGRGGEPARRTKCATAGAADPVMAILAGAGVEYTHDNAEVIGSSKIETLLSREAVERVRRRKQSRRQKQRGDDKSHAEHFAVSVKSSSGFGPSCARGVDTQKLVRSTAAFAAAAGSGPLSKTFSLSSLVPTSPEGGYGNPDHPCDDSDPAFGVQPSVRRGGTSGAGANAAPGPQFRPPEDVRCRHLCSMARSFGFPDPVAFALAVEASSVKARQGMLDRFYRSVRAGRRVRGLAMGEGDDKECLVSFGADGDGSEGDGGANQGAESVAKGLDGTEGVVMAGTRAEGRDVASLSDSPTEGEPETDSESETRAAGAPLPSSFADMDAPNVPYFSSSAPASLSSPSCPRTGAGGLAPARPVSTHGSGKRPLRPGTGSVFTAHSKGRHGVASGHGLWSDGADDEL